MAKAPARKTKRPAEPISPNITWGNNWLIRELNLRRRLYGAFLVMFAAGVGLPMLLPVDMALLTRGVLGWDVGVVVYLATTMVLMVRADEDHMRRRARVEDPGKWVASSLAVVAAVISLIAIGYELNRAKDLPPGEAGWHIAVSFATIFLSWALTHTIFAQHYAREHYAELEDGRPGGGLDFPGDQAPDYFDFLYFAFVIGMTFQVSDVTVPSRYLRRIVLAHSLLAFLFNTVILAATINIVAGLF